MIRTVLALLAIVAQAAAAIDMRTALLTFASAALAALVHFASPNQPTPLNLPAPARGIIAIVGGALIAGIDAVLHGTQFLSAVLVALSTSMPPLVAFALGLVQGKPPAGGGDGSAPKPQTPTASDLQGGQHPIVARLGAFACVAAMAVLAPGCGANIPKIVQTAQSVTSAVQTVLNVLSPLIASYFAIKPDPVKEAHLHDLVVDLASADAAFQRISSGSDKALGGDVAAAYANLDKAYSDLMVALTDLGILKKTLGAGASGYAIAFGKHADEAVPPLPKLKGAS